MSKEKTQRQFGICQMILSGVLFLLIMTAAAGCSSQKATETTQLEKTNTSAQTSNTRNAAEKGQANPAVKAAMDIIMLQRNTDLALTSAQCTSIKPLLEELIAAADPSDELLQNKADAITKLFTEEQKTFLNQKPQGKEGPPADANGNTQAPPAGGTPPTGTPPGGTPPDGGQASGSNTSSTDAEKANTENTGKKPAAMEPAEIYQQALAALK